MNTNKLWMTAQTPSSIGMPISGYAFGTTAASQAGLVAVATDVRDCHVAGVPSLVEGIRPGTSAWRPPNC
jgi:hypothetical protein